VTIFEIAQGQRAAWQRRSVAELTRILDAHRDLPVIAWTVGRAGATLVGRVHGLAPAVEVRRVFDQWRVALGLEELSETTCDDGTVYARGAVDRNQIRLALTVTVLNYDESEG
jgi:hypothetical protein